MKCRWVATALCAALLCGCATKPQLPSIRSGSPISLSVVASTPPEGHAAVRDTTVGENVSTGAGAVAGALWGLSCGRFFLLCAPFGALVGSGVGVAAGGAVGLVMQVLVGVRASEAPTDAPPTRKAYEYVGPLSSLAVWLDDRNDFAQTSLRGASQQIALQIIADLASD